MPIKRCWRAALLSAACIALPALGAKPPKAPAAPAIADKEADLQELRGRIGALRKDLAASEEHRSEAADRLRESERQISNLQRELYSLARQRGEVQDTLRELARQSGDLEGRLGQQQAQLERLVYLQYLHGTPDPLRLLLNGDDPSQTARQLHYLSAVARARSDMLGEIRSTLGKKKALGADTKERADELATIESEQKLRHAELAQQREQRKAALVQISDRIDSQRKEMNNLQHNEKRLSQLIDHLTRLLAAQAAKPRAKAPPRPAEAEIARRAEKIIEPSRPKPVEVENHRDPEANNGQFARLKGSLRLPARGGIAGRFGAAREGGGIWKGLFIRTGAGSEVKAVAGGRVVFAEWMRGFGNLLIIDHGDSYLSIYGNNDSLLKQVGDIVKGGETVATVGNSGGNSESGLYFELRHQGQPIDPMKWASLK